VIPGFFHNETGLYEGVPRLMGDDWYVDTEGLLSIMPAAGAVAESEGPDTATEDELNRLYRKHGGPSEDELTPSSLARIDSWQKRVSALDGYDQV
jgi:hypothetical protein